MIKTGRSASLRRSARINLRVPVIVSGNFSGGKAFEEDTFVLSISKYGAKLISRLPLKIGMEIKVQPRNRPNAAMFRVVWKGLEGTPRAGEVGIEYVEVSNLLGIAFPD